MDEARAVLERLERIEAMDRAGADAPSLLAELRELVREATEWADVEGDPDARAAAEALLVADRRGAARDEVLLPN
ncbi:MAG: hypothetical protein QOG85_1016 [Gaiellaceae bacterium]|jgi:hypothetical protein|nr:hypothetical protein [Gaiellaceae bacterium]